MLDRCPHKGRAKLRRRSAAARPIARWLICSTVPVVGGRTHRPYATASPKAYQTLGKLGLSQLERIAHSQVLQVALLDLVQVLRKMPSCSGAGTAKKTELGIELPEGPTQHGAWKFRFQSACALSKVPCSLSKVWTYIFLTPSLSPFVAVSGPARLCSALRALASSCWKTSRSN